MSDPEKEFDQLAPTLSAPRAGTPPVSGPAGAQQPGTPAGIVRGAQVGTVRLVQEIGRGGMGVVWRGHDQLLARDVAVKFLGQAAMPGAEMVARFVEEMRAAAAVRHPNLIHIYHAELALAAPCLVMEFIDGPSLRELLASGGAFSPPVAVAVLEDIAGAVAALHEHGLVHRDLKPANVLMDATATTARAVVTDLGLAVRRAPPGAGAAEVEAAGTPLYMAPELYEGRASPRSDIYALGLMAFEMLAGRRPFEGTVEELRECHASKPLPVDQLTTRGISGELIEVIERAAHKQPIFRYKTAGDFLRALKSAAGKDAQGASAAAARVELCQRVHRCRGGADVAAAAAGDAPAAAPSSTDGLAAIRDRIVASRREAQSRGETLPAWLLTPVEQAPAAPALPPAAARVTVGPVVDEMLPCILCDYNLWSRPRDSFCPECGTPIASSYSKERLLFADAGWVKRVTRGLLLMLLSPVIVVVERMAIRVAEGIHRSRAVSIGSPIWVGSMWGIAMLVFIAGALMTASKRPGRRTHWTTILCRASLSLPLLAIAGFFVAHSWGIHPWQMDWVMALGLCVPAIGVALHLHTLTRGQRDPGSIRWLRGIALILLFVAITLLIADSKNLLFHRTDAGTLPLDLERVETGGSIACVFLAIILLWIVAFLLRRIFRRALSHQQALGGTTAKLPPSST